MSLTPPPIVQPRSHLIIDGDDTLWENNVYFERAIAEFVAFLDHSSLAPGEVRAVLDEIEIANIAVHGYGAACFAVSLRECFERLTERGIVEDDVARVVEFERQILEHPIELIHGVEETLTYLADRHDLILLTKGQREEQQRKVDHSSLAGYFEQVVIVEEKDASVYTSLVEELSAEPDRTWMIGNSPKSDINPALEAGLSAAFVPHEQTWRLEWQSVGHVPGRLLILERFTQLRMHF